MCVITLNLLRNDDNRLNNFLLFSSTLKEYMTFISCAFFPNEIIIERGVTDVRVKHQH